MSDQAFVSCSDVARAYRLAPRTISDLYYRGLLDDTQRRLIGGRKLIPTTYLPEIERILRECGIIRQDADTVPA